MTCLHAIHTCHTCFTNLYRYDGIAQLWTKLIWLRLQGITKCLQDTVQEGLPSFCVRHDMFLESHKSHQSHISIYQMQFHFLSCLANLRTFFLRFLELSCMASWFSCLSVLDLLQVGLSAREVLAGKTQLGQRETWEAVPKQVGTKDAGEHEKCMIKYMSKL